MSEEKTQTEKLNDYLQTYLKSTDNNDELEIRFGTNYKNKITRIKFDNIIKKLKSLGFSMIDSSGKYHLNIQPEYNDLNTGKIKLSNVRTEIKGFSNIQNYCNKNTFNLETPEDHISFIRKKFKVNNNNKLFPLDLNKFECRLNYKIEEKLSPDAPMIRRTLDTWKDNKKSFRMIKRFTFVKKGFPFKFDLSILKTSKYNVKLKRYITEYNVTNADLFNNLESYEVELELLNVSAKRLEFKDLINKLKRGIMMILSALQNTNYPIPYTECEKVLLEYTIIANRATKDKKDRLFEPNKKGHTIRKNRKNFIGPSSITLEAENIIPIGSMDNRIIPNINMPYTVTDKADGHRKLLYVSTQGKIYLIDINMNIEFTGSITKNKSYFKTIIDGEHIYHDKKGNFINLYMCFDIYFKNGKDIRKYPLLLMDDMKYENDNIDKTKCRHDELNLVVNKLEVKSIIKNKISSITIKSKEFYNNISESIFKSCRTILNKIDDDGFLYETDGLIFTPINKSVGSDKLGDKVHKKTWIHSLKWKPPEFNTIDFLVTTKKNPEGNDLIKNLFQSGNNFNDMNNGILKYKILELRVGFDEKKHGFLNPFDDVLNDNIPDSSTEYDRNSYKPVLFQPTEPTPNYDIYNCNMVLKDNGNGENMYIEDNSEVFEGDMIVEFKFDKSKDEGWQWVPIRVRHDKTSDYKRGNRNYGNAYHVAESVWKSIHNPITRELITSEDKEIKYESDEVYYKKTNKKTTTKSLRDFHNKFVKKLLIKIVAYQPKMTLIDMSVGKGGDMWKWYESKLSFVLGIDYSKANIEDRKDGACARYLNFRKKYRNAFKSIYLHGNSGMNYISNDGFYDDKSKRVFNSLMGLGEKDKDKIGKIVYNNYGLAKQGFDIVSNMFSIHYFFENFMALNEFMRNASDMAKVGSYFIGSCYDGRKVFNMLKNKTKGESEFIVEDETKMWEITKMYSDTKFENNFSSVGYRIDVYQESINKTFPEYLVNFDYLSEILELYGFEKLSVEELKQFGLKQSIGSFENLYEKMKVEVDENRLKLDEIGEAMNLTDNEKKISYLNNYFIFKKARNVDTNAVFNSSMAKYKDSGLLTEEEIAEKEKTLYTKKRDVIKYKRKIKLI